jgi:hypothetical protein
MLHNINTSSVVAGVAVVSPYLNTFKEVNDSFLIPFLSVLGVIFLASQIYFIWKNKGKK